MENKISDDRAHNIALRIYVELVARNCEISQDSVKLAASAANIANLSIKLSEAFLHAEAEAILAREPVRAQALQGDEMAKWGVK
jgi:hypothetical protein